MNRIRECWSTSKAYRILLVASIVYVILRLAVQLFLFYDALQTQATAEGAQVSVDLQLAYIPAAEHFRDREDLYLQGSLDVLEYHYNYAPSFAFFFGPLLLLPLGIQVPLHIVLHIAAYMILYIVWARIFEKYKLSALARMWAKLLPAFLVFTVFWDDLAYLNIYVIIALFATFLIEAVLDENLGWAIFWLGVVILPIKPFWGFALAVPFLLGRYKFFFQLLAGSVLAYLAVAGVTILAGGMEYGIQQYQDYFGFLGRLSRDFPWRGPWDPFLGYNHSVMQIVLYYLGVSPSNMQAGTIVKLILLLPLAWTGFKFLRHPIGRPGHDIPETALALAFALYLGAFIWLDTVWELSLAQVIFAYLITTIQSRNIRLFLWVLFAPYALLDIWRLVSYIALGDSVLYEGAYVLTDPLIYVPWIMMVLLVFYALLLRQLNRPQMKPA
ncbi:MAG TPA: hypothetical protein VFY26_12155 [Anaerolineales bacterium]|nr:hypothetical protein [Anaerolineales bacterium]